MKKFKSLLTSKKFLITSFATLLAIAGAAYAANKSSKEKEEKQVSEMLWQDDFPRPFFGSDIFAEMEAMEKQMNKAFEEHRKLMAKMFSSHEMNDKRKADQKNRTSLALYQDEKSYRYELTFSSFKKEDVVVSVDGGILTISAKTEESKKEEKKGESHFANNFFYSLSIPSDAAGNPEIKREDGKVTVKFEKVQKP